MVVRRVSSYYFACVRACVSECVRARICACVRQAGFVIRVCLTRSNFPPNYHLPNIAYPSEKLFRDRFSILFSEDAINFGTWSTVVTDRGVWRRRRRRRHRCRCPPEDRHCQLSFPLLTCTERCKTGNSSITMLSSKFGYNDFIVVLFTT